MLSKLSWKPLALAGALAFAAVPALAQEISLGTMAAGSVSNSTGAAVATVLSANGVPTVPRPGGGESEIAGLVSGEVVQLGIASIPEVVNAYEGKGFYADDPQRDIRVLAALAPLRVGFYVRNDSGINSLADLRGKRVTMDFTTLPTIDTIAQAVLANAGLSKSDVTAVSVADVAVGANEFMQGRADAFFFALPGALVGQANATVTSGIKLLPLDTGDAAVARMEAVFPQGMLVTQPPAPNLAGFSAPTAVIQYDNLLLVNADVSDETAGRIAMILATNKAALAAAFPGFNAFLPAQMYKAEVDALVPYHPGAKTYLQSMPAPTP